MAKSGPPLPVSSENNSRMSKLVTDFGMKEMTIAVDLLKVMKYTSQLIIIWASPPENLSSGCQTKRVSNQSPQLQGLARQLKFHTLQVNL